VNESERLTITSFLLGRTHGAIMNILENDCPLTIQEMLRQVEFELRNDIQKLFYSIRDPSSIE
jgi:hypothetical protein